MQYSGNLFDSVITLSYFSFYHNITHDKNFNSWYFYPAHAASHSSPGGDSQVLVGAASEGVGTEAVINPLSSQKALIIHNDVAKCHRTHFMSPAKTEPLKDMINGPNFHLYS